MTLFLLGSNVVWAYDGIDITQDHKKQNHTDAEANTHTHQDNEHQSCDHCCHGSSHFLGIFSGQSGADTTSIICAVTFTRLSIVTNSYQPPTPPPNV